MTITAEDVAEAVRGWAASFGTRELNHGLGMEAKSFGYGFRNRQSRDIGATGGAYAERIGKWIPGLTHYSLEIEELRTRVAGDTGFAWGFYVEETESPGEPRERAVVSFSKALQRDADGSWHILMFHRDIQPFDDRGSYLKELTATE